MLKIIRIQLFDINWEKDITLPNKETIMLKNDSEIKYGITAEDFGVEFITNMSFASNVD